MSDLFLGIGAPTIDQLIQIPGTPSFGSGMLTQALGVQGGGPVPTALVAARRLGRQASLATCLGVDSVGDEIIAGLVDEGIDLSLVQRSASSRSASSVILVDPTGERAILYDPGENTEPELTPGIRAAIRSAGTLLLDRTSTVTMEAAREARDSGVIVELDAGGYDEQVMQLVSLCDVVIASAYHAEERGLTPREAVDELLGSGAGIAIVTLGPRGAVGRASGEEHVEVPAMPVDVVDTTGAGDVYHGAFLVAWLERRSLPDAMRFAAVVAGLTCRKPGGRAGIPDRPAVEQALMEWPADRS